MGNLEPPDNSDDLEIERLRQELAAVERIAELRSELEAARAELGELGGSLEAEAPEEEVPEAEAPEEEVPEAEAPEGEEGPSKPANPIAIGVFGVLVAAGIVIAIVVNAGGGSSELDMSTDAIRERIEDAVPRTTAPIVRMPTAPPTTTRATTTTSSAVLSDIDIQMIRYPDEFAGVYLGLSTSEAKCFYRHVLEGISATSARKHVSEFDRYLQGYATEQGYGMEAASARAAASGLVSCGDVVLDRRSVVVENLLPWNYTDRQAECVFMGFEIVVKGWYLIDFVSGGSDSAIQAAVQRWLDAKWSKCFG